MHMIYGDLLLWCCLYSLCFFLFFCDMVWHRGNRGDHGKCLPESMWPHIWACGPHQRRSYGFPQVLPVSTGTLVTSDLKDHNLIHVKFKNNVYLHFYSGLFFCFTSSVFGAGAVVRDRVHVRTHHYYRALNTSCCCFNLSESSGHNASSLSEPVYGYPHLQEKKEEQRR